MISEKNGKEKNLRHFFFFFFFFFFFVRGDYWINCLTDFQLFWGESLWLKC